MKAAILTAFGGPEVIQITDRPVPQVKPNQVLVKNHAATVNSGDARIRSKNVPRGYRFLLSLFFGFKKPKKEILGTVFAGEVSSVGADVTEFKPGDLVFGSTELKMGTHAEFVAINDTGAIAPLPKGLSPIESAAIVFGGTTAQYFIQKTGLKMGERILVNAAAGSVGIAMVQIALAMGAHVTGVASAGNHAFLTNMGADEVVDYNTIDLTNLPDKYDVVADCLGTLSYSKHRQLLAKAGRFALITGTMAEGLAAPFRNLFGPHKIVGGTALVKRASLNQITKLAEAGSVRTVIDKTYPLDCIQDAYAHVDAGHKRGDVVLTMS
jgi:NADPH:quinone reductase-like Zn-dependent oxidoreductase